MWSWSRDSAALRAEKSPSVTAGESSQTLCSTYSCLIACKMLAAATDSASGPGNAGSSTGDGGLTSGDGTWAAWVTGGSLEDMFFKLGAYTEVSGPRIDAMAMG